MAAPTIEADLQAALARAGFAAPADAVRHLRAAALGREGISRVVAACADAADPDLALVQVCRWIAISGRVPSGAFLARLAPVLGLSTSLGAFLARHPEHAEVLRDGRRLATPKRRPKLALQAMRAVRAADDPLPALRVWKRRELLRIAARDLAGGASVEEVGRELAHLAEAALQAALASLMEEHPAPPGARFCVIGMGKLGGEELNYSSDIDVMFVYDGPGSGGEGASRASGA
ncbi:MAG: bifunctional glutamine-synthetase adenylyltransferase/deadenyltransferase, partial [Acidobacteria bacterium]|nr:bifunctional glutamine-synthetase adenylyltransferase/deadenyltransferase [Acidobacteriota bacterium]